MINSVLSTLPSHHMSVYGLPKWIINRLEHMRRAFLWKGSDSVSGFYCLVNWSTVCKTKEQDGLGVKNLAYVNQALLAK